MLLVTSAGCALRDSGKDDAPLSQSGGAAGALSTVAVPARDCWKRHTRRGTRLSVTRCRDDAVIRQKSTATAAHTHPL